MNGLVLNVVLNIVHINVYHYIVNNLEKIFVIFAIHQKMMYKMKMFKKIMNIL